MSADAGAHATDFDDDRAVRQVEACYLTADVTAQRDAVLRMLVPRPGERILDVGSGPGLLACAIGEAVGPHGEVLGVDTSRAMVASAGRRCAHLPQVRFEVADACRLPVADQAFDAVACLQVLEFVADVAAALRECHRVLRPGGRLLVMDTDWTSCVWHSGDDARMRRVVSAWDTHCPHPRLPRKLAGMLGASGFARPGVEVLALLTVGHSDGTYCRSMAGVLARHAVKTGAVGAAEADAWRADLARLDAAGEYFFSLNRYVFSAVRR